MAELSDEDLRAALQAYDDLSKIPINVATRSLLLKKLASRSGQPTPPPPSDISTDAKEIPHNVAKNHDERNSNNEGSNNDEVKNKKSIKFNPLIAKVAGENKANNYPIVGVPQLNSFRHLIEENDVVAFSEKVNSNPHHLVVSDNDTPVIVKSSSRYNALHAAVIAGKVEICKKILEFLKSDSYWSQLYPNDHLDVRSRRRDHLIDLYLNMVDKTQETPLHFACKYGHTNVIEFLLTFPELSTEPRNAYGKTPREIACTRYKGQPGLKNEIFHQIRDLLSEPACFVTVVRAHDNSVHPKLGVPCTVHDLALKSSDSPLIEATVLSSVAGPMSPAKAQAFYKEWRSPSQVTERKEATNVKRSDPDRGMERVGRRLAHRQKVQWMEYWEFMNCSCDMTKEEGKLALENYLQSKFEATNHVKCPPLELDLDEECSGSSVEGNASESGGAGAMDADVVDLADVVETRSTLHDDVVDLASAMENTLSLQVTPPKRGVGGIPDHVFLTGNEPSKLDHDILLALGSMDDEGTSKFPSITRWLRLVNSYTEEEQKRWSTPISVRQQQLNSNHECFASQRRSMASSPLLYSSPHHLDLHTPQRHSSSQSSLLYSSPSYHRQTMTPTQLFSEPQ